MVNDNPFDSAETLRIMADLERYADMHAPRLSDSADVMDEARHRLAILQQFANGQGTHGQEIEFARQVCQMLWDADTLDCGDSWEVHNLDHDKLFDVLGKWKVRNALRPYDEYGKRLISDDDADYTEDDSPYDASGNLIKGDFDDDDDAY